MLPLVMRTALLPCFTREATAVMLLPGPMGDWREADQKAD
jgi:hypothetical protein